MIKSPSMLVMGITECGEHTMLALRLSGLFCSWLHKVCAFVLLVCRLIVCAGYTIQPADIMCIVSLSNELKNTANVFSPANQLHTLHNAILSLKTPLKDQLTTPVINEIHENTVSLLFVCFLC